MRSSKEILKDIKELCLSKMGDNYQGVHEPSISEAIYQQRLAERSLCREILELSGMDKKEINKLLKKKNKF